MADNSFKVNRSLTLNPQTSPPTNPINGDTYYDSTQNSFVFYNNGQWLNLASRSDVPSAASLTSADFTALKVQNSIIKVTGSTAGNISGIAASSDAKPLIVYNSSSAALVIKNQNVTEGTPANRIVTMTGADVTLNPGFIAMFFYDSAQSRWILAETPSGSAVASLAPTITSLTSTGTTTGYLFTTSAANATTGDTYTNNGNTFTVLATIVGGTQLFTSGALAPTSSGTLTKATGAGDATITFSAEQPLATYTTPSGPTPLYLKIRMVGGGGGGGASGPNPSTTAGGTGGITAFGSLMLIANGGAGGNRGNQGGTGGSASFGTALDLGSYTGQNGSGSEFDSVYALTAATVNCSGGAGGSTPLGGGGGAGSWTGFSTVQNATGYGGGGGGAGKGDGSLLYTGSGGGSGGYVNAQISTPTTTYVYTIGAAGSAGTTSGGGTFAGGAGGAGAIIIEEYYQ